MLNKEQMDRWSQVNQYLEDALNQVGTDPKKTRQIKNVRSKLAWALDQFESGLASKHELIQNLNSEVAEKFKEIVG
jgi:hypothetical protein